MTAVKYPALLSAMLLFSALLLAQDKLPVKFGKVSVQDFSVQSPVIKDDAGAVVIADWGKSEFSANTSEKSFSISFLRKKRIKILNKQGYDAATVEIPLYVGNDGVAEKLENLDVHTYNLEGGKVETQKLDKASVFTEKTTKNWTRKKFTFPGVKEGSILEMIYEVRSPYLFNLRDWVFQGQYPVLWTQYEANIPEFFKYVISSQGYQPFSINKSEGSQVSFKFTEQTERRGVGFGGSTPTGGTETFSLDGQSIYHTWQMKDVPALKEEVFTTTIDNAISKIEFQLKQIAYPNQFPKDVFNSWEKVATEMKENENFGVPISRANNWLDEEESYLLKNVTDPLKKAKLIYQYVRDNFTCTSYNRVFAGGSLKDVFKNKSGSVAELNLLLIAMLRHEKLNAKPIILSTRSNGLTSEIYPLMDKYNYTLAALEIDGKTIYLDASRPRLAFGKLPLEAYNGHARVVDNEALVPVYFHADSLVEESNTTVFIYNNEKGGVEASFMENMGYYQSLSLRQKLVKIGMEEYKKECAADLGDEMTMANLQLDSLKMYDEKIGLKYDLSFKMFGDADVVYFNPIVGSSQLKKNPFAAAERLYPVEMPYCMDESYVLNMEIPNGYVVDELPKSARIMLNEDEGMFEYLISKSAESVQMRCRLHIGRANFSNDDYQTLRDFFAFVVNKHAEQIVFKKKK